MFGPAHTKALEELRTAQVQLALAWMRTESDDLLDGEHAELAKRSFGREGEGVGGGIGGGTGGGGPGVGGGGGGGVGGDSTADGGGVGGGSLSGDGGDGLGGAPEGPTQGTGSDRGGDPLHHYPHHHHTYNFGAGSIPGQLPLNGEGGMEKDTLLARKRRELNDAHFNRVSLSVMDVIQKLENVATRMGVVETESREIWGSDMSDNSSMK